MTSSNLLCSWRGLNDEQIAAVSWGGGKTLVNACAGSGKTAVAAAKVAGWIESGVPSERILMLTFTRKAAHEMKSRVGQKARSGVGNVSSGTYHAVALRLMREGVGFGGCSSFTILDDDGVERLWKRALKESGGDPKEAGRAAARHSLAVNLLQDPDKILEEHLFTPAYGAARKFSELKKNSRVLDFDDILIQWRDALSTGAGGRGNWTHVMVDEFQDNSELQYDILKNLGAVELFVVGDPNQCIYSFRGSAPRLMARFAADHPECREYSLSSNYRSGQEILDEANYTLLHGDRPAHLQAVGNQRSAVYRYSFSNPSEEAEFVARGVLWRLKAGTKPHQVAILFRSGHQSSHIEMALRKGRIPYRKYGGSTLTDAADVKDFLPSSEFG